MREKECLESCATGMKAGKGSKDDRGITKGSGVALGMKDVIDSSQTTSLP